MSAFWQVLGRFCAEEAFRQEVLANHDPETTMMTDLPGLHNVLTGKYSYRLTRWEFMEVNRLVGRAHADDFATIQALWGEAPRFSTFYAIIGLCCIDRDLRQALHGADDVDEIAQVLSEPPGLELASETHRVELLRLMGEADVMTAMANVEQFGWVVPSEELPEGPLSCAAGFRFTEYRHLELQPPAA